MNKKIKIKNQEQYEALIISHRNKIIEEFRVTYDSIKNKEVFKNRFLSELRRKTVATQSNPDFLGVYDAIKEIDDGYINSEPYYNAIIQYCNKNVRDVEAVINYLTSLNGEILAENIISIYPNVEAKSDLGLVESNIEVVVDRKNYTTARQIIAMKFILAELNPPIIDQTNIARFLHVLSRGELVDKIQNRNIYQKLLELSHFTKASITDLRFVKGLFEKMELHTITANIDKEIKKLENLG
jgi:hypothetical protein